MNVQLAATKGNELPPAANVPVWLKRGAGGALLGVDLEQVERGSVGQRELDALDVLRKAAAAGDVTMKFWREQCVAAGIIIAKGEAGQKKAMERIRDALLNDGLVQASLTRGLWKPA